MTTVGDDAANRLARRKRVQFLKKLIIFILVMAILIPTILCIILGVQLHSVRKELKELQAQVKETSVIYSADEVEEETGAEENTDDLVSGVDTSDLDSDLTDDATDELLYDENVRKVYLTFDDGPSSNTEQILDILAEYDVKATFFVVGKEEEKYQALYKRIVDEGHTLGMHSYSHKYDEIYQSVDSYAQDMSKLQEFLYDLTGVECKFARFPGGSSNAVSKVDMRELIDYLDEQEIVYFDWNISSGDASSGYISTDEILTNCMTQLPQYKECIILMHDASNKDTTVEALPMLIEQIQAMEDTIIVPITEDTEPIQHIRNDERMEDN
ncbi:MAG: polysaccharide deacetylase [Lachnospiraceae bacterium]|nr:polysaccharide deacetylase [Lachnospiraceae bacterium]